MPSYDDIFRAGARALVIRPSPFSREVALESESTANIVLHVNASMAEETAVFVEQKLAESQFATAVQLGGAVLDRLAYDRYGEDFEPRRTATVAVTVVQLRRLGTIAMVVPKDTRVSTGDGIVWRTIAELMFPEGEKGPLDVFVYSTVAGPDGNVVAGSISTVLDQPADDPTLIVTNQDPGAGGHPEEEDGEVASRMRGFWLAARKATKTAIEYAARTAGVASAIATEILDPLDPNKPTFRGTLTVADKYGNANAALADRVRGALVETRALGVPIPVFGSTPIYLPIRLTGLVFRQGQDTAGNRQALRESIVADVELYSTTGGKFAVATVIATLQRFVGADKMLPYVPAGVVTAPGTDQDPPTLQTQFRTRADLILINGS